MNTSMTLFGILGIAISILLLKHSKSKKGPIIALIIFTLMLFSSFSKSNQSKENSLPSSANITVTQSDNSATTSNTKNTETPVKTVTEKPTPTSTLIPVTEIPTMESTPTEEATSLIEESPTPTTTETETPTPEKPKQFILSWDEPGEYGEKITLNKGTEAATTFIIFRIPAGVYNVKNNANRGAAQITVYSGITQKGQIEELTNDNCPFPIIVMAGKDPQKLEIKDGQFVKLSDNSSNIEFVKDE